MSIRAKGATLAALVLVVAGVRGQSDPARAGGPIIWTLPGCAALQGRPPAPDTLQACIDGATSGDTIRIATDAVIDESPSFSNKSLDLVAAPGFHPHIKHGLVYSASGGTQALVVRGIRFDGEVFVDLEDGIAHTVLFDQVVVHAASASEYDGMLFSVKVPVSVSVMRSTVSTTAANAEGIRFQAGNDMGVTSFRVVGSRISAPAGGNQTGIVARGYGDGTMNVDLYNDVISQVANCGCDGSAAVDVVPTDNVHLRVRAVGLTIDRSGGSGLHIDARYLTGGSASVTLYNSILSRVAGSPIAIRPPPVASRLALHAGTNDYHGNGAPNHLAGRSIGSHNLFLAPRFVNGSAGDLRLRSDSPLIDRGQVCSPAGIADPDPDGHHRLQGRSVDLGAYEFRAGAATGTVVSGSSGQDAAAGTSGADIFCGYGGADDFAGRGGADYIDGGRGVDFLTGDGGPDRLFGQEGSDILCGADGSGKDVLVGGPGTDRYDFDAGDALVSVETLFRPCHD